MIDINEINILNIENWQVYVSLCSSAHSTYVSLAGGGSLTRPSTHR